MPKGWWPRGVIPLPRSGAATRVPECHSAGTAEMSYPMSEVERRYPASEVRGGNKRSYSTSEIRGGSWEEIPHALKPEARSGRQEELHHPPKPEARGGGREELPHAVAARAQEGLEELSHIEGQEGRR